MEKYQSGFGYKWFSQSTIKSISQNRKNMARQWLCLEETIHQKQNCGWVRKSLVRKAAKRPSFKLKELERVTDQMGEVVHRTVAQMLHQVWLYGRVENQQENVLASNEIGFEVFCLDMKFYV